jgi:hypothetical protein
MLTSAHLMREPTQGPEKVENDHLNLSDLRKHIMGALLPQMGNDWVPRGLSIQAIQTSELPYQEEDEFTYWH